MVHLGAGEKLPITHIMGLSARRNIQLRYTTDETGRSEDKYKMYYVYAYLRENGTPYYIGKGKFYRAFEKHLYVPVPKNKDRIVFLERNLTEVGSLALERRMIEWYGRKDNGTGILRNLTAGGEGAVQSFESRQKISKGVKEYYQNLTEEQKQTNRQNRSQAAKLANRQKVITDEERLAASLRAKKQRQNETEQQRRERIEKQKRSKKERSQEQKDITNKKRAETFAKKTLDEIKESNRKRNESHRLRRLKITDTTDDGTP